jgi:predicted 3-demethylubiquinone-9 3-methyltransferase (glyoxalase superfamily)
MTRPYYTCNASCVCAETAAALAIGAIIFDDSNYLDHAKSLFDLADSVQSDETYTASDGTYSSHSGFWDELVWAATWLYIATEDSTYLTKAESYVDNLGKEGQTSNIAYKWPVCWDDVHLAALFLLNRITGESSYDKAVRNHLNWLTVGDDDGDIVTTTPGGLIYIDTWGSLRYASNAAFLAFLYSDFTTDTTLKARYKNFAISQIDYIMGSNPRSSSYIVGFGNNYPKHPHHRTSQGSYCDNMAIPETARHILYGALVGGPDSSDNFSDEVGAYQYTEPACDYNALLVGNLAKMHSLYGGDLLDDFPEAETVGDEFFMEASINSSGSNYTEIKALCNNRSGWPARLVKNLSYNYYMDLSEVFAAGYDVSDLTVSTNYVEFPVTISEFIQYSGDIYYIKISYEDGTEIYPGGLSEYAGEVQFRIAAPSGTSFWDPDNDFSYTGLESGTAAQTEYIPVYDGSTLLYGNEPGESTVVATPTFSPAGGTYTAAQSVTINCATSGATIYYTTDGSTPTEASNVYSEPITVSSTTTINAYATASGKRDSKVASATYTIDAAEQVATPTFSPAAGTYSSAQSVVINCATDGATIYYTTDGSTPTSSSTVYSGAITVSSDTTIKAYATASGMTDSEVATAAYTISTAEQVATPTFSPAAGTYSEAQSVTMNCTTDEATIYYTTDGSTPTEASTVYTGAIPVSSTTTIKAYATADEMTDSEVASATYIIASTSSYLVTYTIADDWGSGAVINVTITNNSSTALSSWTLAWTFPGNQEITNLWNGSYTQDGALVSVTNLAHNGTVEANGGTVSFGFQISYSGSNAKPDSFTLNGEPCVEE